MKMLDRTFRPNFFSFIVLSVLLALMLVACGSEPIPAKPLKVGVLLPLTGARSSSGFQARRGIELAYSEYAKTATNRKLELSFEDIGATKEETVNAYRRLLAKGKPDGLIAGGNSVQAGSLSALIKADSIPALVNVASNPQLSQNGNDMLFFTRTLDDVGVASTTQFVATQLKKKKVAIVHSNDEVGFVMSAIFLDEVKKQNLESVANISTPTDASDFSEVIKQVKASGAEVLISWHYTLPAQAMIKQFRAAGLNIPIVGSNVAFGLTVTIDVVSAEQAQDIYAVVDALPVASDDPIIKEFVKNFQADNNPIPDGIGLVGYDSLNIMGWAANQGATDPLSLRKTLTSLKNYKGLKGMYNYDPASNGRLTNSAVLINLNLGKPFIVLEIKK